MKKIVLGSASERRKNILREMGYDFEVMSADIDEKMVRDKDPVKLTLALAHAKADVLLSRLDKDAVLITSDIVGVFNGEILERPELKEEGLEVLKSYGDQPLTTVCAVVVTNTGSGKQVEGVDIAKVWFKPFTRQFYKDWVDSGLVLQYAASIGVMHPLCRPFVEKTEGTIESIAGLPKELTERLIREVSI